MNLSKVSLGLNLVLLVAVLYLFYSVQQLKTNSLSSTSSGTANDELVKLNLPSNLVFINIDSIDAKLEVVKQMRKEMKVSVIVRRLH